MVYSNQRNGELDVLEQLVDELVSATPRQSLVRRLFAEIGVDAPQDADAQITIVFDRIESLKQKSFTDSPASI